MNNSINYIELPMVDKPATMAFYTAVFDWTFTEWGDSYISIDNAGLDGGFDLASDKKPSRDHGALVVLYADDLEDCLAKIKQAGGEISQEIFSFPGGRRFHFIDPNGNELAVWVKLAD